MACSSLVALPRVCADGVVGGLEKVYMIAFKDLAPMTGTSSSAVYSASTSGIVNRIQLSGATKYVQIGLLKSTSGLDEKLTKDNTKGTNYFTQTFKVVLSDLTIENQTFIKSVVAQPVSVILKTRNGRYYVTGLNGLFEVSQVDGSTGTAEADLVGYTVTFEGISNSVTPLMDESILSGLI